MVKKSTGYFYIMEYRLEGCTTSELYNTYMLKGKGRIFEYCKVNFKGAKKIIYFCHSSTIAYLH